MSELKLGSIIEGDALRDAIHVAVAPVVAVDRMWPGQDIGIVEGTVDRASTLSKPTGIVDPFLKHDVKPGQKCWMFLYPNTITGMRHHWQHPAFREIVPPTVSESEQWLRSFADECGLSLDRLLDHANTWLDFGEYHVEHGSETMRDAMYAGDNVELFWKHFAAFTGKEVPEQKREGFFSCSC